MAQGHGIVPTILLTGFLGAGKTTLLNRLIVHYQSKRTVLLLNEFGKVGIDGELLVPGNYRKIELNKGSLFCICVRTDFIAEVEKIARQLQPELLIIEATGLADTSEMEKMLSLPNLRDYIRLQICLGIVDCTNFLKIKDILRAPASQIRSADLILVNKIDLVPQEQVEKVINAVKEIAPATPVIRTSFTKFSLDKLEVISRPKSTETGAPGDGRPDPVVSITLEQSGFFTRSGWDQFKALVAPDIMRLKGFICLEGESYYVDAAMDCWSMMLTDKPGEYMNRLVVIGQKLDQGEIEGSFRRQLSNLPENN